jgi:hypothetical protein
MRRNRAPKDLIPIVLMSFQPPIPGGLLSGIARFRFAGQQ